MSEIPANDPSLKSWVTVPENSDFPIQNLPFGIFKRGTEKKACTAIGDHLLDLDALQKLGLFHGQNIPSGLFGEATLNAFIDLGRKKARAIRNRISELLSIENEELRSDPRVDDVLLAMKDFEMAMPVEIKDYTDFYASEQHAKNVGMMFRDKENALLPNWKHIPVGYHGRASSVIESGVPIHRPKGQVFSDQAKLPAYQPTEKLDFELEVAFITSNANEMGSAISTDVAEDHIFGLVLLNDWSARDIQKWEYVPLGPFLGKNFASSISPWIVTLDALEPFRIPGPIQNPAVLPYLNFSEDRGIDINLEVSVGANKDKLTTVSQSNFKHVYWNMAQQLAHHSCNGCNVRTGDLYGSGTISGTEQKEFGSLLELTWNGTKPLDLADGSKRTFLKDYDFVKMTGFAKKEKIRIGFGEVSTQILPAK